MGFPYVGVVLDDKAFPFPSTHHRELTSESHALLPHGQWFERQKSMLAVDAVCCARIYGAFIKAASCNSPVFGMNEDGLLPELLLPEELPVCLCTAAAESCKFGVGVPDVILAERSRL